MVDRPVHRIRAGLAAAALCVSAVAAAEHPREAFLLKQLEGLAGSAARAVAGLRLGEEQLPLQKFEVLAEYLRAHSDTPASADQIERLNGELREAAREGLHSVSNRIVQAVSTNGVPPAALVGQVDYLAKSFDGPPFRLDVTPVRAVVARAEQRHRAFLDAYAAHIDVLAELSAGASPLTALEKARLHRADRKSLRSAEVLALDERLKRTVAGVLARRMSEFTFIQRAADIAAMEAMLKAPAITTLVDEPVLATLRKRLERERGFFLLRIRNASGQPATIAADPVIPETALPAGATSDPLAIPVTGPGLLEVTATPANPELDAVVLPVKLAPGGSRLLSIDSFERMELDLVIRFEPALDPPVSATVVALPDGKPVPYRPGMQWPVGAYELVFTRPDYQSQRQRVELARGQPVDVPAPPAASWEPGSALARLAELEQQLAAVDPEAGPGALPASFPELELAYSGHQRRAAEARSRWGGLVGDRLLGAFRRARIHMSRFRDYLYQVRTFHEWDAGKEVARMRRDLGGKFFGLAEKPYNQILDIALPEDVDAIARQLGEPDRAVELRGTRERLALWREYVGTNQLENRTFRERYRERFQAKGQAYANAKAREVSARFFYDALVLNVETDSVIDFEAGALRKSLGALFGSKIITPPIDPEDDELKRINAHLAYHRFSGKGAEYLSDIVAYLATYRDQTADEAYNHFDVLLAVNYFYEMNVRGFSIASGGKIEGATPVALRAALSGLDLEISRKLANHLAKEYGAFREDPKYQDHVEWNVAILLAVLPERSPARALLEQWQGNTLGRCEEIMDKINKLEKAWWSDQPEHWVPTLVQVEQVGGAARRFVSLGPKKLKKGAVLKVRAPDRVETGEKGRPERIVYGQELLELKVLDVDGDLGYLVGP